MAASMDVIEVRDGGARLERAHRPRPTPAPGEVLIRVHAAGINRADLSQRDGRYPPPAGASDILGLECAGEIAEISDGVTGWRVGDRVCALLAGGGYAQYCAVPAVQLLPAPAALSWDEAAAIVESACTVWDNVFTRGRLAAGESLLVQGGSSGIGVMAIQIAKALDHPVIVTVGSAAKRDACLDLGADAAAIYSAEDFVAAAKAFRPEGVDLILDMVGGPYLARNLQALAPEGRLCVISVSGGAVGEADLRLMMQRRLTVLASTLRARAPAGKAPVVAAVAQHVWPLIEAGQVRPVIDTVYGLDEVEAAHARMRSSAHVGKLIIRMS